MTRIPLDDDSASDKWIYALCFTPDSQALFAPRGAGDDQVWALERRHVSQHTEFP
ncbi:MAG: hypothetical protein U0872_00475 [Planctomycetaceae bacterium]